MGLRERAIPMLCTMAHSTTRGRAALMAPSDGASVFLNLLLETPYQVAHPPRVPSPLAQDPCPPCDAGPHSPLDHLIKWLLLSTLC